jgi:hypothetical protein
LPLQIRMRIPDQNSLNQFSSGIRVEADPVDIFRVRYRRFLFVPKTLIGKTAQLRATHVYDLKCRVADPDLDLDPHESAMF